ncbi:dihydrolipoamide acetyltransferase family protein [Lacibacter sediminis]|uniref:Dihydrolipoamide acetyltransferase component of pyruvate dehydrogenase complex n=1 Tax=Lacibacter sediminis TaxID=2760713 RepID=A0A7G5XBQ0_9BACT|nr:dihydrolipoamide acetyltransferase family protein [Lacibacter sediminis]QNA42903.1 2-oxo acid dehydrogenase subunit E2 [Lacibacter sediminis]
MALVDLVMPKLGESIMEATILRWHKKPGDSIKMDETVLDIATDKVDSEVPSTAEGVLSEVLFSENDVVPIGAVIARIATNAAETIAAPPVVTAPVVESVAEFVEEAIPYQPAGAKVSAPTNGIRFYSPLVLNIAAQEGIGMAELEKIPGTGNDNRVTKKDILQYVSTRKGGSSGYTPQAAPKEDVLVVPMNRVEQPVQQPAPAPSMAPTVYSGNVEIIEMDRMRKLIADHMVRSKQTSPHVTSFTETDVTNLVQWRDKMKKEFEKREGTKITFTPLFIEAIVKCIKKYPLINSSVDGDRIIVKKDINIGMATALPSGNLIVPVIKNADQLNLVGLTKQVNNLADSARNGKLKADDTTGGTFTLTNVGTFGSLMGTPIINQPQVAVLAVGVIKKRPVVIETPMGDSIAIRHMMYLSMSYDHRIIDGSLGATFLTAVANELQNFNPDRDL